MSDGRSPFETVIDAVDWASRSAEPTPSRGDYAVARRAEEATDFAGTRAQARAFRGAIIARVSAGRHRAIRADTERFNEPVTTRDMRAIHRHVSRWQAPGFLRRRY